MSALLHSRLGRLADAVMESWIGVPMLTMAASAWHQAKAWGRA